MNDGAACYLCKMQLNGEKQATRRFSHSFDVVCAACLPNAAFERKEGWGVMKCCEAPIKPTPLS